MERGNLWGMVHRLPRVGHDWNDLAPALPEVEYQLHYWDRREEDGVQSLKYDTYFEKKTEYIEILLHKTN